MKFFLYAAIALTLFIIVTLFILPAFITSQTTTVFDTNPTFLPSNAYDISNDGEYEVIDRTTNIIGRYILVISNGETVRRVFVSKDVFLKVSEGSPVVEYTYSVPRQPSYGARIAETFKSAIPVYVVFAVFAVIAWANVISERKELFY